MCFFTAITEHTGIFDFSFNTILAIITAGAVKLHITDIQTARQ